MGKLKLPSLACRYFQISREITESLFEFNFTLANQRFKPKFVMKLLSAHAVLQAFVSGSLPKFESLVAGYLWPSWWPSIWLQRWRPSYRSSLI